MNRNIFLGTPPSPCKDCDRRFLGCHNVKLCKKWAEYVVAKKKNKDNHVELRKERADEKRRTARRGGANHAKDAD